MGRTKLTISYPSIFHVIISHSPNVSTLPNCRTSFSAGCAGCLTHTSKLMIWPTPAEDIQCNFASEPNTTQAGRAPVCGLAQLRWFGAIYRAGSTLALVGHATSQKRLPGGQTGARPAPFRLDSRRGWLWDGCVPTPRGGNAVFCENRCLPLLHRRPGWSALIVHFQGADKGFLRDVDFAELAHLFLARLLLVQQLALAACVAAVAFGGHVFAHR